MSRVPRWGRGSRRRIRLIRWSRAQIAGVIVLAFCLMLFGFFLARWLASMEIDEQQQEESSRVYLTTSPPLRLPCLPGFPHPY